MFSLLRVWKNARCRPVAAPVKSKRLGPAHFRPQLEPLEDRQAPATHVWSGAVSSEWSDPGNWSSGGSPYADPIHQAIVIFPATGVTRFTSVHNLNGTAELYSIVLQGSGYTLLGDAVTVRWEIDDQSRGGNNKIDYELLGFDGFYEEQRINVDKGGTLNVTAPVSGAGTYALRKEGGGTLLLPRDNNLTRGVTLDFGRVVIGTNTSLGTGPIEIHAGILTSSTAVTLSNPLTIAFPSNADPNIDGVNDMRFTGNVAIGREQNLKVTGSRFIQFDGVLSGPGGVTMFGDGELTLSGDNTFEGDTYVSKGFVSVEHNNALGQGRLYLNGGGLRRGAPGGSNIILRNAFEVSTARKGRIENDTMELTLAGPGQLNGDLEVSGGTIDVIFPEPPPIVIRISGPLFGPGRVTMIKEGELPLGNYTLILGRGLANTYKGVTNVLKGTLLLDKEPGVNAIPGSLVVESGGVVRLAAANQIADGAAVAVNGSGLIEMNDFDDAWGSLEGDGLVETADPPTLTVGGNNRSTTFGGVISGPGTVVKVGTGTWTLNGTNTHTGGTVVREGTLLVNGAIGAVTVDPGATLGGTGTTGPVTLAAGAGVSPGGATPGIQKVQDLALSATSTYVVQLNGPDPGTGYDQLDVTGTVNLNDALLEATLGFTPTAGQRFVIINNDSDDPVIGTFAGLPQGAFLSIGGVGFHIYYDGGDGNDVELVRNVPPTVTLPGPQTAYQNVDLGISGLAVGDPDDVNLTVTLQVNNGTLTLVTVAGLSVGGNGTSSVTLYGSQAALNAALASLLYRGAHNYSGLDTLTVTASDGSASTSASLTIQVKSVAEQAADLQTQVKALHAAGVLNEGQANSLIVKLNLGDNDGDVGRVQAFLHEVAALLSAGILSPAQADALLGLCNVLLAGLIRR